MLLMSLPLLQVIVPINAYRNVLATVGLQLPQATWTSHLIGIGLRAPLTVNTHNQTR